MKALSIFAILLVSGWYSTNDTNEASVSIFREGKFTGVGVNYRIWIDNQEICTLSNDRYINIKLKSGVHTISSKAKGVGYLSNPKSVININVEKGQSYFLKATAKMKGVAGVLELKIIGQEEAEKIKTKVTKFDNCQKELL
ncbi:MAG: DUF2846 domain-containing protein [Runella zeae]